MKQLTGHAKMYDWTGCTLTFYGDALITKRLGDFGTDLPKESIEPVYLNVFEPKDVSTSNLTKYATTDGVTKSGVKCYNFTNSTIKYISGEDLVFIGQPTVEPYNADFKLADINYPDGFRAPWGSGSATIPFWAGTQFGSGLDFQRKKYFWENGKSSEGDEIKFNGKMKSLFTFTEESPKVLQYYDVVYLTLQGENPIMSSDDIKESDATITYENVQYNVTRWRHKSDNKVYFGRNYGEGVRIGFYGAPGKDGERYAWNLTVGPAFGIIVYNENGVEVGSISKMISTSSSTNEYLKTSTTSSYNNQNITALTSYSLGATYKGNKVDDVFLLVDQTSNVSLETSAHYIYYGSVKTDKEVLLGDSTADYTVLKYLLENVYRVSDPYEGGGTSKPGGGNGTFDYTSDNIGVPSLPTDIAINAGLISIYAPTPDEVRRFSQFLFSSSDDGWWNIASAIMKQFANPLDVVISYCLYPFSVGQIAEASELTVGGLGTGLTMHKAAHQYVEIDCGIVHIDEFTGSYMDYASQYDLFLPFIGNVPLRSEDVVGKDVKVVYHVDIITGSLTCFISVDGNVLYNYNGACGQQLPLSATDYSTIMNGVMTAATSIVGAVAAPSSMSSVLNDINISSALITGGMSPNVQKSGSMTGPGGMLNILTPYITITAPDICLPESQSTYKGYPLMVTKKLSEVSGFTVVDSVHLEGINATSEELAEIERLLMEGVVL